MVSRILDETPSGGVEQRCEAYGDVRVSRAASQSNLDRPRFDVGSDFTLEFHDRKKFIAEFLTASNRLEDFFLKDVVFSCEFFPTNVFFPKKKHFFLQSYHNLNSLCYS